MIRTLKHKIDLTLQLALAKTFAAAVKTDPTSEEAAVYARLYLNADDRTITALKQIKDGKPAKRLNLTFTHLWSTHCPPCVDELADIIKLSWELYILGAQLDIVAEQEQNEGPKAMAVFIENGGTGLEKYLRISNGFDNATRRRIHNATTQPMTIIEGQGIEQTIYEGTLNIREKEAILKAVKNK